MTIDNTWPIGVIHESISGGGPPPPPSGKEASYLVYANRTIRRAFVPYIDNNLLVQRTIRDVMVLSIPDNLLETFP